MRKITTIVLLASLLSCKGEKEKNLQIMEEKFKQRIHDISFKQNGKINIIEFNSIDYIPLSKEKVDTLFANALIQKSVPYTKAGKIYYDQAIKFENEAKDYKKAGMKSMAEFSLKSAKENFAKAVECNDSANYYVKAYDDYLKNPKERKGSFFQYSAYIKAKETYSDGKQRNFADTIKQLFNDKIEIIEINN